jgi:excisionase family DNA binding protein
MNEKTTITMNAKAAAEFIGISYWSLLELCKRGAIPFIPVGKKRLFRESALLNWIAEREQSTITRAA